MARTRKPNGNSRKLARPQSVNAVVKSICDIMRRSNCAGALQYVSELTWILFLRILDERDATEAERAEAVGAEFAPSLEAPYRWRDWAAPDGPKRAELQNAALGAFFGFVHGELPPHLRELKDNPGATPRQKVISEIMSGVEKTRIDTERNFRDVLDKVHEISSEAVDPTHVFTLSQVYEGLLLKMGEKGNDGGQFFTPREIIRAMVRVVDPKVGEAVYDPGCGTGGFLAQSFEHMAGADGEKINSPDQLETLKHRTFFGREKDNTIYPIALANLILHNIDEPRIWHGNTLTGAETYGGLFSDAPQLYDVVPCSRRCGRLSHYGRARLWHRRPHRRSVPQALARPPARARSTSALGDILRRSVHPDGPAVGAPRHGAMGVESPHGSVGAHQAMLELEGLAVPQRLTDDPTNAVTIARVDASRNAWYDALNSRGSSP